MLRSKHPSDAAFEDWVDDADGGATDILRTHVVQAGFRGGWIAATSEQDKILSALVQLLAAVNVATLEDPSKHRVANRVALPALVARDVIWRHGLQQDLETATKAFESFDV